ncbi:MAG: S8 family serine peptidase [Acidobacteria bacterium]|nr:S8 family serine peptidase [Acidobacteriota bacterium]
MDYVMEDARGNALATTQPNPPSWGLDRVDQRDLPLNQQYNYINTGAGVRVYVIDTGIRFTHQDFGGRAFQGTDVVGDGQNGNDCAGHGTHVAGTIGGTAYGVAKNVSLYSVRVLDCFGGGSISQIVSGVEWVTNNHVKPAVANMSLRWPVPIVVDPINTAVKNSIAAGVTYVLAAGNENGNDAILYSPAGQVEEGITVAASGSTTNSTAYDQRASYSNAGPRVDIYAPGTNITSAYSTSNTASAVLSGTSMAAPHVAGMAALFLQSNTTAVPSTVASAILAKSTPNKITSNVANTPNRLLFNDYLNTVAHAVTVNAASYIGTTLAPDSYAAAFGSNLATTTASASNGIFATTLPTQLGGTTVKVRDVLGTERFAPIVFVTSTQVNYIIPNGTAYGSAIVTITNSGGVISLGGVQVSTVGPGAFAANANGSGLALSYILRVKANGTQSYEATGQWNAQLGQYVFVPINLGPVGDQVYLIQYATGFRYRSALSNVTATIGGLSTPVLFAGPEGGGNLGLDQVNSGAISRSLIGAGVVNVVTKADGRTANTVQIQIQ